MAGSKNKDEAIVVFESRKIRRDWHQEEWWFSVIDVVAALTDSTNPRDYWYKMKIRVKAEDGFEPSTVCRQFKMKAPHGKMRKTDRLPDAAAMLPVTPERIPKRSWAVLLSPKKIICPISFLMMSRVNWRINNGAL